MERTSTSAQPAQRLTHDVALSRGRREETDADTACPWPPFEPATVDDGIVRDDNQESPCSAPTAADSIDASWPGSPSVHAQNIMAPMEKIAAEETVEPDDVFAPDSRPKSAPIFSSPDAIENAATSGRLQNEPDQIETLVPDTHTPSTLSPSTALKTPTRLKKFTLSPLKAATISSRKPPSAEEHNSPVIQRATSSTQSSYGHQDTYWAPRPRRRPSALDYLVESPIGTASSSGATFGSYHMSGSSNVSAPPALNGTHGDAVSERPDALRRMGYCSGPGEVPSWAGYQRSQAFGNLDRSPPMAPNHVAVAEAALSQVSPSVLQAGYVAEKPPMSGYQLLAAKLVGGLGGRPVTPIYRRFEALNHRLLLYMQADLVELEKELQMLDSRDTIERGYGVMPSSRRQERWTNNPLAQQRTEILGQIGYKLSQYNKVMASVRKTQDMAIPSLHEIVEYKTYLTSNRLLADEETSFLDAPDDLVCLLKEMPTVAGGGAGRAEGMAMPLKCTEPVATAAASPRAPESEADSGVTSRQDEAGDLLEASLSQLALAVFAAVLVPVFTFAIIPGFAGRITVVGLVGASIAMALVQSGLVELLDRGALDWVMCAGAYGAVMAVVAGVVG
ncbi:hypothetical protein XA68_17606 [Ophiocordyceps unilateralis]|uniref:DUF6594 domain-containing protein n=1 Tax=Ophiocordyceps unilateralis TaxID=268505 RepID=A0A2A9P387_OPHUN|nr:hypothetical protein XA68_17606 [Ophiocordyceps unilateralis]